MDPRLKTRLAIVLLILFSDRARPEDWPQWRGANRDGVWRETGLIERFSRGGLTIRWRVKISGGYSGPTVSRGRVFVSDFVVEGTKQEERVHCFKTSSGDSLWTFRYDCPYRGVKYTAGPRASVTIDEGRAYALGTMGHFHCLDAETGEVLFRHDLASEYKIDMPSWGISSSPLIEREKLFLQIGGSNSATVVAFQKKTGEELWRALDDRPSYSSPILIDQANQRVLVVWTGSRLVGLSPSDGSLLWEQPTPQKNNRFVRFCASPVWDGKRILLSSFFDGSMMFDLGSDGPTITKLWERGGPSEKETDGIHTNVAEPLILGDHIYGVDSYGQMRCLDAKTGDRVWENLEALPQHRWSTARFVPQGDRVWMFTEWGELVICRLSPEGYEEISRAKLIGPTKAQQPRSRIGVCWAHPAFAQGHVYARNDEELVCARLR